MVSMEGEGSSPDHHIENAACAKDVERFRTIVGDETFWCPVIDSPDERLSPLLAHAYDGSKIASSWISHVSWKKSRSDSRDEYQRHWS
jgi:hypothetical protein